MRQVARTLTMADERWGQVLICDRDSKWSRNVRRLLADAGIRVVRTPERAPNVNAFTERFVRSINEECLDRLIPIGERHFRSLLPFRPVGHRDFVVVVPCLEYVCVGDDVSVLVPNHAGPAGELAPAMAVKYPL